MTDHPFLSDLENAKAYQTLCDCPSGSIRSWAARAGWTKARMERFVLRLKALQLARIESGPMGSIFVPGVSDSVSDSVPAYLGSKAVTALDKVPRYGEAPKTTDDDRVCVELILIANRELKARGWDEILTDNHGSLAAARKMLKIVPFARAWPLLEQAIRLFNPSASGGNLYSLGHPFITRYVINEFRRTERDLARGQLSLLFVERAGPPAPVYGTRKEVKASSPMVEAECKRLTPQATSAGVPVPAAAAPRTNAILSPNLSPAGPERVDQVAEEWRATAKHPLKPQRMK